MPYKYCIVPGCTNTTVTAPGKIYFDVPRSTKREEWCKAMNRIRPHYEPLSAHSCRHCCEDHFNMEKDTMNYMQYKMGFSQRILLTDQAVPTKFHCQEDCKSRKPDTGFSRKSFLKRSRIDLVTECLKKPATETNAESLHNDELTQEITEPEGLVTCTKTSSQQIETEPDSLYLQDIKLEPEPYYSETSSGLEPILMEFKTTYELDIIGPQTTSELNLMGAQTISELSLMGAHKNPLYLQDIKLETEPGLEPNLMDSKTTSELDIIGAQTTSERDLMSMGSQTTSEHNLMGAHTNPLCLQDIKLEPEPYYLESLPGLGLNLMGSKTTSELDIIGEQTTSQLNLMGAQTTSELNLMGAQTTPEHDPMPMGSQKESKHDPVGSQRECNQSMIHLQPRFYVADPCIQVKSKPTPMCLQNSLKITRITSEPNAEYRSQPIPSSLQPIPSISLCLPSHSQCLPSGFQPLPSSSQSIPSSLQYTPSSSPSIPSHSQCIPSGSQPLPSSSQSIPSSLQPIPLQTTSETDSSFTQPLPELPISVTVSYSTPKSSIAPELVKVIEWLILLPYSAQKEISPYIEKLINFYTKNQGNKNSQQGSVNGKQDETDTSLSSTSHHIALEETTSQESQDVEIIEEPTIKIESDDEDCKKDISEWDSTGSLTSDYSSSVHHTTNTQNTERILGFAGGEISTHLPDTMFGSLDLAFKNFPCLWNPKDPDFRTFLHRKKCMVKVLEILNKTTYNQEPMTLDDVKRKVENIGRRRRRLLKRVKTLQ